MVVAAAEVVAGTTEEKVDLLHLELMSALALAVHPAEIM
jgi:hypothetical protein